MRRHCKQISYETPHEKTLMETKKIIESTRNARNVSRSLNYKWHKRFSDGMANLGDGSWRPLQCEDKYEMPYSRSHERKTSYIKRSFVFLRFLIANHLFLQFSLKTLAYFVSALVGYQYLCRMIVKKAVANR